MITTKYLNEHYQPRTTSICLGVGMMKKICAALVVLVFILAGCQSAFELPAGCDANPEEIVPTTPSSADNTVPAFPTKEGSENVPEKEFSEPVSSDGFPTKSVIEGALVAFPNLKAVDPDGDKITYSFSAPLDAQGRWRTKGSSGFCLKTRNSHSYTEAFFAGD